MITSDAPGHVLDRLRRIAGPSPEGSRITDAERLHLIWMLTTLVNASGCTTQSGYATARSIKDQLTAHGMPNEVIGALCRVGLDVDPVQMADAIAVHPSIQPADYLD